MSRLLVKLSQDKLIYVQVEMKLTIRDAGESNFGKYSCVAKNPRGQTDGSITLYGKSISFFYSIHSHLQST